MRTSTLNQPDIRSTPAYRAVQDHFKAWLAPGFETPHAFAEVDLDPAGESVVATASVLDKLEGIATTRLIIADATDWRLVTGSTSDARAPRFSPDGSVIAFLSDRTERGIHQLHLLRRDIGEAEATPAVDGSVEYLDWSPDDTRLLLGVAGRGADVAAAHGSGSIPDGSGEDRPDWLPDVLTSASADNLWRTVWVHELETGTTTQVATDGVNVWDARWCGADAIVIVATTGNPREEAWFGADLRRVQLDGTIEDLFRPRDQFGVIAANPAGTFVAVVDAICSDRAIAAGEAKVINVATREVITLDTLGTDISDLDWLDDDRLGWAGLRGFESVLGTWDGSTGKVEQRWVTTEATGHRHPQAAWSASGACAIDLDSYQRPPTLAIIEDGEARMLVSTANDGTAHLASVAGTLDPVSWEAPDDLEIQGLLARPSGRGPFPMVVMVHGGPIGAHRNRWSMGNDLTPLLVQAGYSVLHPNPRGSTGRGAAFARQVVGDMGGADTRDHWAGIDALVDRGIVDQDRIGVIGGSYGGFMTTWLIGQDDRFKAAVAIAPITDWYSQHHTSNLGAWDARFLDDAPRAAGGLAWARSPVMHVERVVTPTLLIAGGLDRATPPTQAIEFHTGLVEAGVESQCVIYPQEGHGVRGLPGRIDVATRVLVWFERHMPA